jgi:hypothetical protein
LKWVKPFLPREIDEEELGFPEGLGEIKNGDWASPKAFGR